jgi:drug/metabolite transporter (DMT)-like permease
MKRSAHTSEMILTYVALVFTTLLWGNAFVAIKIALRQLEPFNLVVMRFVPASLLFAAILVAASRLNPLRVLRGHGVRLVAMGLLSVFCYNMALNTGEQQVAAGTASLIIATSPIFTFILAGLLLKERITSLKITGLVVSLIGLVIIVFWATQSRVDLSYIKGALITIIAPLSWALYTIVSKPIAGKHHPVLLTGWATILGTIPLLLFVRAPLIRQLPQFTLVTWGSALFLAVACTVIGFTVWLWALRRIEASRLIIFVNLVPMFSVVCGRIILHEPLTLPLIGGGLLILAGVTITNRG